MTGELGHLALMLAFVLAAAQAAAGLLPGAPPRLVLAAVAGQALAVVGAFGALALAFAQADFTLVYVVQHSNAQLPLVYRLAAVWGGHEGSMLLWALVLAGWSLAAAAGLWRRDAALARATLGVLGMVALAMLGFVLFTSNPFVRLLPAALEGQDLNPLLQDPGLVLHPPLLYLGYVGTAVPFAMVVARLLLPAQAVCATRGADAAAWVRWLRPYTLWAFTALTLGIALGSWWAYYELGWGGWWFWDPVENASLMPWFALAALLHVLPAREQRGVYSGWMGALAVGAFTLSLIGTFLVRSGVLTSVHAFATDPRRGSVMLALVGATLLGATALLGQRAARLAPPVPPKPYALASREALLGLNNALLVAACGSVLLGTLYPLAMDALAAGKISVGPPYFDAVLLPLLLPLVAAGALAPWLAWGQADAATLARQLAATGVLTGLGAVLLPGALYAVHGSVQPLVLLPLLLALGLALSTGQWLLRQAGKRQAQAGQAGLIGRLRGLARLGAQPWGMALAHLGVAVFVVGVAMVKGHGTERDVRLAPGQSTALADCRLTFDGVQPERGPNYAALRGRFTLACPGQPAETLAPEKRAYPGSAMPMTESAIRWGWTRDLYVALGDMVANDSAAGGAAAANPYGAWTVRVQVKPFMRWVWGGALLMALGSAVAALARRYRRVAVPAAATLPAARPASLAVAGDTP